MILHRVAQHTLLCVALICVVVLGLDYLTGPNIRFSILLVFPVVLTSWYRSWYLGMGLAMVLSSLEFMLTWNWQPLLSRTTIDQICNWTVSVLVLGAVAYLTARHRLLQQQVRVLRGILPICSFCKKIRDQHGNWQVLEDYIRNHTEAEFSHGYCEGCVEEHYGKFLNSTKVFREPG